MIPSPWVYHALNLLSTVPGEIQVSHGGHGGTGDTEMDENEIGAIIIDTAIFIHKKLGPGLLESVYESVLAKQISKRGLHVQRQVSIPIEFDGDYFEEGFRADLFVEGKVIIELKSIEKINDVHKKQLLTYLRMTNTKLGYILNFGAALMKDGIVQSINGVLD